MKSKEEKQLINKWKKIEEKFGLDAWNEVRNYYSSLFNKIEDLIKSRNKWREKYLKLKNGTY